MLQYSIDTTREDGASNYVIMNGVTGFIGRTNVKLSYMRNGCIILRGSNNYDIDGWQRISEFSLEPGKYTFSGIKEQSKNSVALQLVLEETTGAKCSYYQYDDDVALQIKNTVQASLYIRVYPSVGKVNMILQPAVYKDE